MPVPWLPDRALSDGETLLLEASAGTGKTWQIEGLVVRLVAVHGIPIDRLLIITFTREATADLRNRVRLRLVAARDALASDAPSSDPVLQSIRGADRQTRRRRVVRALAEFDRAAISTIHGFCQRMLDQLAFESDQEPDLSVVADARSLREEMVADAIANVYAQATADEAARLRAFGFESGRLSRLVKALTGPVRRVVFPTPTPVAPLDVLRHVDAARAEFAGFLSACDISAWQAEFDRPTRSQSRGRPFCRIPRFRGDLAQSLQLWRDTLDRDTTLENWIRASSLRGKWAGDEPVESFPGWPLAEALERLALVEEGAPTALLAGFACGLRERFDGELSRRALLTYDSMLSRLAEAIADEEDSRLASAIRDRYDVALVDEFQDTDQAQWTVLRAAFRHASRRLYLIGDPKQAIYRFRGADLDVYLDAARDAERHDLVVNYRTDEPLVEAANLAFTGCPAPFGSADIAYTRVRADKPVRIAGLSSRPLELRWLDLGDPKLTKPHWRDAAARACAAECRELLDSGVTISGREIRPGDIAVLVTSHDEASLVADALRWQGIPAIAGRRRPILGAPAVHWLAAFLDAVAAPEDERKARTLAVTPLFGWRAGDLLRGLSDAPDEPLRKEWEEFRIAIAGWCEDWAKKGLLGVLTDALARYGSIARLLASEEGERGATDVRHLAEILHAEDRRTHPGPRGLLDWLRAEAGAIDPAAEDDADEQAMRLESDADAVQIVTLHASKGLQYPIVLLPFAWANEPTRAPIGPLAYRENGVPALSLHADRPAIDDRHKRDGDDEKLRLLYVGLTRAEHHCVVWLSASDRKRTSPISRLLLHAGGDPVAALSGLAASSGGRIGFSTDSSPSPRGRWRPSNASAPLPDARTWPPDRHLGTGWLVTSYSGIARRLGVDTDEPTARSRALGLEPEDEPAGDEPDLPEAPDVLAEPILAATLPGRVETGDWLHDVFENLDFGGNPKDPTLTTEQLVARSGKRHGRPDADHHALVCKLLPGWLDTPLDAPQLAIPEGYSLRRLSRRDRLDELAFDMRLGSGTNHRPSVGRRVGEDAVRVALATALGHDDLGAAGWLRATLANETVIFPRVAGLLTGFVDLVFREEGRYFVADYKSNRIRGRLPDGSLAPVLRGNYTRPWLTRAMDHAAYHLQALVYTIALHRLLALRLGAAYDYDLHVGGHLYLFLMGMEGVGTPRMDGACLGVYADRWPRETVVRLSEALG